MNATLKQIESLNLSCTEIREMTNTLMENEQSRSRNNVGQVASLLVAMLKVAQFEDNSILQEAVFLQDRINAVWR